MRVFVFRSHSRPGLGAFAGDTGGTRLPEKFGPWRLVATVPHGISLPHGVARPAIEDAIQGEGFQLYRLKADAPAA